MSLQGDSAYFLIYLVNSGLTTRWQLSNVYAHDGWVTSKDGKRDNNKCFYIMAQCKYCATTFSIALLKEYTKQWHTIKNEQIVLYFCMFRLIWSVLETPACTAHKKIKTALVQFSSSFFFLGLQTQFFFCTEHAVTSTGCFTFLLHSACACVSWTSASLLPMHPAQHNML